jgi:gas vesicle protein
MSEMSYEGNGSGGTGILLAAAAGAIVGAGVALLFAPCSGAETRDWLARRSQAIKAGTTSAIERGKQAIQRTANEIRSDVAQATSALGSIDPMRG